MRWPPAGAIHERCAGHAASLAAARFLNTKAKYSYGGGNLGERVEMRLFAGISHNTEIIFAVALQQVMPSLEAATALELPVVGPTPFRSLVPPTQARHLSVAPNREDFFDRHSRPFAIH